MVDVQIIEFVSRNERRLGLDPLLEAVLRSPVRPGCRTLKAERRIKIDEVRRRIGRRIEDTVWNVDFEIDGVATSGLQVTIEPDEYIAAAIEIVEDSCAGWKRAGPLIRGGSRSIIAQRGIGRLPNLES